MPLSHVQKMKFSPELKKLLDQNNISEKDCDKKLTDRGMHVMNMYVKLIHLRLYDNMPGQKCFDQIQHEKISHLMQVLNKQSEDIPCRSQHCVNVRRP